MGLGGCKVLQKYPAKIVMNCFHISMYNSILKLARQFFGTTPKAESQYCRLNFYRL